MATTTNYSWSTPDDTALVKDGAAAIRTLGSSIDTTTKNLNPQTTTGALAFRSATSNVNTALPIGTAGQVLKVNSGATAPEWGTVSVNDTFTLLNAGGTSLTGATTITVSGISNQNKLHIQIQGASAGSGASLSIRLNTDTGSNYSQRGMFFVGLTASTITFNNINTTATGISLAQMGTNTADTISGTIDIRGTATSGIKPYQLQASATDGYLASNSRGYVAGGAYLGTSSITSISIISSSGNFDAGSIFVYGA